MMVDNEVTDFLSVYEEIRQDIRPRNTMRLCINVTQVTIVIAE